MSKSEEVLYADALKSVSKDFEKFVKELYLEKEHVEIIEKVREKYHDPFMLGHTCFSLGMILGKRMERAKRREQSRDT